MMQGPPNVPAQVLAGQQGGLGNAQGAVTPPPDQATPQPPTVPPPQAGGDQQPTLQQTAQQAQQEPDIDAKFQKYLALTQAAAAANQREHLPESSRPGILANILTFGMAGAMHHDYEAAYNAAVDRGNQKIGSQAVKDAIDLVGKDVSLSHGDIGQQIAMLRLQQSIDQARLTNLYRRNRLDIATAQLGINQAGLGLRADELDLKKHYKAPTPEQAAAYDDAGLVWVSDPKFPGFGILRPKNQAAGQPGGTTGDRPPDPRSGGSQQGPGGPGTGAGAGATGAGGTGAAGGTPGTPPRAPGTGTPGWDPSDPNEPNILQSEKLRRQKNREKEASKPLPAETQKDIDIIDESLKSVDALEQLIADPNMKQWIGPVMTRGVTKPLYKAGYQ